jgi:hypothetical protein
LFCIKYFPQITRMPICVGDLYYADFRRSSAGNTRRSAVVSYYLGIKDKQGCYNIFPQHLP